MIKRETARGEILDRPPIRIRQTVQEPPHPENPWLNTVISGDKGALAGWRSILQLGVDPHELEDRKSTRLNSSHSQISYAVFCLKKKNDLLVLFDRRYL